MCINRRLLRLLLLGMEELKVRLMAAVFSFLAPFVADVDCNVDALIIFFLRVVFRPFHSAVDVVECVTAVGGAAIAVDADV